MIMLGAGPQIPEGATPDEAAAITEQFWHDANNPPSREGMTEDCGNAEDVAKKQNALKGLMAPVLVE